MNKLEQAARRWTAASNIVDDGYGHSFSVISSEPANTTSEPYVPLYAAPVQQVPVGKVLLHEGDVNAKGYLYNPLPEGTDLYAAPVRTKDLTDDEIDRIACNVSHKEFARAVITADREKNK